MTRPKVSIVTACKRPENLTTLWDSIRPGKALFTIDWYVVLDALHIGMLVEEDILNPIKYVGPYIMERATVLSAADEESVGGNAQRNFALDCITDGWVYFLDDDTIVHPNFWHRFRSTIAANPQAGAVIVGQNVWGAYRGAVPEFVKRDHIDTSQFIVKRGIIGDLRWPTGLYQSDAYMIEHMYNSSPKKFIFVNEPLSYYNKLRPGERQ